MQIELIGCTGVGKSTFVRKFLHSCQVSGISAFTGDQFVLHQVNLNWINSYLVRTILVDILTLSACLFTYKRNQEFIRLIRKILHDLPPSSPTFEKLNILRNTLKKIGAYEIVRRRNSKEQIVIFDEGTIHTAHYLFVQTSVSPSRSYLPIFLKLVPLPDVVIYLQEDESVLIKRIQRRNHKRIPDRSYETVKKFIKNAIETFSKIEIYPSVSGRLIKLNSQGVITTSSTKKNSYGIQTTLNLIHETFQNGEREKVENNYV